MTDSILPGTLQAALRALSDLRLDMAADMAIRKARQAVQDATHNLEAANSALEKAEADYREKAREIEGYVVGQVLELGRSCEHAGVRVSHRAGYDRITWDDKKLMAVSERHPEIWASICGARRTTPVSPSVKIE